MNSAEHEELNSEISSARKSLFLLRRWRAVICLSGDVSPCGVWRKLVQQLVRHFAQCARKKSQSQVLWLSHWGTAESVTKSGRRSKPHYLPNKTLFSVLQRSNFGWTCTSGRRVRAPHCWHTRLHYSPPSLWPPACTTTGVTVRCPHCHPASSAGHVGQKTRWSQQPGCGSSSRLTVTGEWSLSNNPPTAPLFPLSSPLLSFLLLFILHPITPTFMCTSFTRICVKRAQMCNTRLWTWLEPSFTLQIFFFPFPGNLCLVVINGVQCFGVKTNRLATLVSYRLATFSNSVKKTNQTMFTKGEVSSLSKNVFGAKFSPPASEWTPSHPITLEERWASCHHQGHVCPLWESERCKDLISVNEKVKNLGSTFDDREVSHSRLQASDTWRGSDVQAANSYSTERVATVERLAVTERGSLPLRLVSQCRQNVDQTDPT